MLPIIWRAPIRLAPRPVTPARESHRMPNADQRQPWALILGASSGFGEGTAVALAEAGYDICGVHLDRRQGMAHVDEIKARITAAGRQALFFNGNAADDEQRATVLNALR